MMQGSGGMVTADRATERPIGTLSSGPAAGAIAAAKIAQQRGLRRHRDLRRRRDEHRRRADPRRPALPEHRASRSSGACPPRVPMLDVESVGAGGGSIGWIDQGGALKMGPQSAGVGPRSDLLRRGRHRARAVGRAAAARRARRSARRQARRTSTARRRGAGVREARSRSRSASTLERVVSGMVEIAQAQHGQRGPVGIDLEGPRPARPHARRVRRRRGHGRRRGRAHRSASRAC